MTWGEWLSSKYNNEGWIYDDVLKNPGYSGVLDVETTEVIIPNFNYRLYYSSGSGD